MCQRIECVLAPTSPAQTLLLLLPHADAKQLHAKSVGSEVLVL